MVSGLPLGQESALFSVRIPIGRSLLYAALITLICPVSGWAQNPNTAATSVGASDEIEEIIVTGSRLRRRDFSAPSPLMTIEREALDFSGQTTLESTLNQMPQITPDFDRTANNRGDGKARINLRGLGAERTLVMLNGRRLAPSGIGTAVDVNNLPQMLIERVEIITGGATTVYGSDAVAGVVNFVTRDDFDGLSLDISGYATEEGDSNIYDINIAYGHNFSNGRGNLTVFGGYYDREETFASERDFTAVVWQDRWDGTLQQGGSVVAPEGVVLFPEVDFGDGPGWAIFEPDGTMRAFQDPDDKYNWQPLNYLQLPMERYSGGVFLNYEMSARTELYVEAAYTENRVKQTLAPVPVLNFLAFNIDNPLLPPETQQIFADNFIPLGGNLVGAWVAKRMEDLGPRILDNTSEYSRIVTGLRGDIWSDWEFDAWLTFTKNDEQTLLRNSASFSRLQQGLLVDPVTGGCMDPSDGCVPVNIYGLESLTPPMRDFIRTEPFENITDRKQTLASAFVRGNLFDTWAGPVAAAFGLEWREDDGGFRADDALFEGDALGLGPRPRVLGSERVFEMYAEALLPLAEDARFAEYLALEIGGRYSDYEHAGSVDTYKAGLEWQIVPSLRFRSMFQRSVRAPNLLEAFIEQQAVEGFVVSDPEDDPCSASADPVGNGNVDRCIITGMPADQIGIFDATAFPATFITGGNPDLEPETAETFTAGLVITPDFAPDLQLTIDYFAVDVEGSIGGLSAFAACFDPANTAGLFCDAISRDPVSNNISEVFQPNINRGLLRTTGIDTLLGYRTDLPASLAIGDSGADLSISMMWTHMRENSYQETPFSTVFDCAGLFGRPCSNEKTGQTFPNDRITTNLSYASGNLTAHLTWRWIAGTSNGTVLRPGFINRDGAILAVPSISHKNYVDLGIGYEISDRISARLAIVNVTDTDPPLMTVTAMFGTNTDQGMFDVFGRSYTLSFSLIY